LKEEIITAYGNEPEKISLTLPELSMLKIGID
jgi:hypothetical protein